MGYTSLYLINLPVDRISISNPHCALVNRGSEIVAVFGTPHLCYDPVYYNS